MRLHFAAELVLELVYQGYGHPEKLGANITAEKARVDFAWEGSIAPILPEVAARVRELVDADLPIDERVRGRGGPAPLLAYRRLRAGAVRRHASSADRRGGRVRLKRANPGAGVERIEITLDD